MAAVDLVVSAYYLVRTELAMAEPLVVDLALDPLDEAGCSLAVAGRWALQS